MDMARRSPRVRTPSVFKEFETEKVQSRRNILNSNNQLNTNDKLAKNINVSTPESCDDVDLANVGDLILNKVDQTMPPQRMII